MAVLKGVLFTFIGILLGWVTVYKIGGYILDTFAGQNPALSILFKIFQFLIMIIIVFLVPIMFIRNPKIFDKIQEKIG